MNNMRLHRAALFLVVNFVLVAISAAQVPMPSGIECVPVPGIPCPGSSVSHSSGMGGLSLQQQMTLTIADAFLKFIFSSPSPKVDAQRQQMMDELANRQAEALRQHNIEEAKRLAEICNRLSATLKLTGIPNLKLKTDASASGGGLKLKLGDDAGGHVGVPGLPGVALNDNTGNGGSTPYGIQGLPGIYTNGPGSGSGTATQGGLQLKTGDESATQAQSGADRVHALPAPAAGNEIPAGLSEAIRDPQNMTPQQLADAATLVSKLPPEEQQRLMAAAEANSRAAVSDTSSQAVTGGAPSQPVAAQLQQIAGASQSAATAQSPEGARANAGIGFDQAAKGSVESGVGSPRASTPVAVGPQPQPAASIAAEPKPQSGTSASTIPAPILTLPGNPASPPTAKPAISGTEVNRLSCPPGGKKAIPTRQQLQTELAVRRAQLESLRNTIVRLNRTVQLDQKEFAVWQDEAQAGLDRVKGRIFDLWTQGILDGFVESKEAAFEVLKEDGKLTAFDMEQWRRLKLAKDIKSFDDFRKWVTEDKNNWAMIDEGARQLIDHLPLSSEAMSYVRAGKGVIDTVYDFTDIAATSERVEQLDHNSTQFLEAVRQNGERMKSIVSRIQAIETQLNATPEGPASASPCRE